MHLSTSVVVLVLAVAFLVATVFGLGTAILVIRKQGVTTAILTGFAAAGTTLGLTLSVLKTISELR
ncbi:hypothetical protein [Nocardia sp. NPDC059239]|uniref:hypothetical protein n=1 Tax=Nocardia sp. NPDC059239 TaxID=3346785 RepID=UPI0036A5ADFF